MNSLRLNSFLALLLLWAGAAGARHVWIDCPLTVNSNRVSCALKPVDGVPQRVGVLVVTNDPAEAWNRQRNRALKRWRDGSKTNRNIPYPELPPRPKQDFGGAEWTPFRTNLFIDLGPGDGKRLVWLGFQYAGETNTGWEGFEVLVQSSRPSIVIKNPPQMIVSQPVIQLQGYSSRALASIQYDVLNQNGVAIVSDEQGFVVDEDFDSELFEFTTNYFTCFDIALDPGTNTIVLRCTDEAGNTITTNLAFVFTTVGDTTPPAFHLTYPKEGAAMSGQRFTLRGRCDENTANITALIRGSGGGAAQVRGFVERNGSLWVENVPLLDVTNYITVIAYDEANNSSVTNIMILQSTVQLTIDPIPDIFLYPGIARVIVTGTISDTNYTVWVNGKRGVTEATGRWKVENLRMGRFEVTAYPNDDQSKPDRPEPGTPLPVVWGAPMNHLQAGICFPPAPTNRPDRYQVGVSIMNNSPNTAHPDCMLPKKQFRYSVQLHDTDGEPVKVKQFGARQFGQLLPTGLNIHRLGKQEVQLIDGIMSLPPNHVERLGSVNLTELFQLNKPGEYRVEVEARAFQIDEQGNLVPTYLPAVSAGVTVVEQLSEMNFQLNALFQRGILHWSKPLDQLRVGLAVKPDGSRNVCRVFLQNNGTNLSRRYYHPSPEEGHDISLYDETGHAVKKTKRGDRQGRPLSLQGRRAGRGLRRVWVPPKDAVPYTSFDLLDYFDLKKSGTYRIAYEQRLYRLDPGRRLESVVFPHIIASIEVDLKERDPPLPDPSVPDTVPAVSTNVIDLATALNTADFVWHNKGPQPWYVDTSITHDGVAAVCSGLMYSNPPSSWLETTVTGPGRLDFWWYGCGNPGMFQFQIDGYTVDSIWETWQERTFYLSEGIHTLKWYCQTYDRYSPVVGWLDEVRFTPGHAPPIILSPQTNMTAAVGERVVLKAKAGGTPPIGFQWQRNGNVVSNAPVRTPRPRVMPPYMADMMRYNPIRDRRFRERREILRGEGTLTLRNAQMADAGDYSVVASNAYGSVTSSVATVSIVSSESTNLVPPSVEQGVVPSRSQSAPDG